MYILKNSGRSAAIGSFKTSTDKTNDPAYHFMKKVDNGTVTDAEISQIKKMRGEVLRFMERRADSLQHQKQHLDRKYGKGVFDGVTDDGKPFKDISMGEMSKTGYDQKQAAKVRPFVKRQ